MNHDKKVCLAICDIHKIMILIKILPQCLYSRGTGQFDSGVFCQYHALHIVSELDNC